MSGISPLSGGYSALTSGLAGLGGLSGADPTATAASATGAVTGTAGTTAAGSLAGALGVAATGGTGLDGLTGAGATALAGAAGSGAGGFAKTLASSLEQVQALQGRSSDLAVQAATGNLNDVHDYTIAAAQAEMATSVTVALRNKALDAFNEIMRMQV